METDHGYAREFVMDINIETDQLTMMASGNKYIIFPFEKKLKWIQKNGLE